MDRILLITGVALWVIGIAGAVLCYALYDPQEKQRRQQRREVEAQVEKARGS